mmetsp:Transcript_33934/g.49788  ORF Transcript_33934/g.49788 Transcript_33934/m.49788 type:complete len:410 (+) Transcript_33934:145-1374(+)
MPCRSNLSVQTTSSSSKSILVTCCISFVIFSQWNDANVNVSGFNTGGLGIASRKASISTHHLTRGGFASSSSNLKRVGWPTSIPPPRGSLVSTFAEQEEDDFTPLASATSVTTTTTSRPWYKRLTKPFLTLTSTIALATWLRNTLLAGTFLTLKSKFLSDWKTYTCIPFVAAFVGWFTNFLAVKMIFYPIQYRGLNLYRFNDNPFGLFGWQGIIPTKTKKMSEAMVKMVTEQLLSVEEVFARLDPEEIARLLSPEMPKLAYSVALENFPELAPQISPSAISKLPRFAYNRLKKFSSEFLISFTIDLQKSITRILNVQNCVVEQMLVDRSKLGQLFQKCGEKELQFLTDSGLWFGFILGLIQMFIALINDNPWTISIGGTIVGYATNWLALKWIFEPVDPTKVCVCIFLF